MQLRKRQESDVLRQKQEELAKYQSQFDDAVSMVTRTTESLMQINSNIADKIKEIDDYQHELAMTRNGLGETKRKNEQIIKNFNALLGFKTEEA